VPPPEIRGSESWIRPLPWQTGPAPEIASLVEASGLANLAVEPLTDAVLWGAPSERQRYALSARKPN
jgi:hypothetical protein